MNCAHFVVLIQHLLIVSIGHVGSRPTMRGHMHSPSFQRKDITQEYRPSQLVLIFFFFILGVTWLNPMERVFNFNEQLRYGDRLE